MKSSRITNSWDAVNPDAAAKARMLEHIQKAQQGGAGQVAHRPRWPWVAGAAAVLVAVAVIVGVVTSGRAPAGPSLPARDLMANLQAGNVTTSAPDDRFTQAMADFSVGLLQQQASDEKNVLVSPLSVQLALAMTANGASRETLRQMQQVLGDGADINDINAMLAGYVKGLPSTDKAKFHLANSIWFRQLQGFNVEQKFLQTNADYYGAGAYAAPFDQSTVDAINTWVNDNTDGMVPKIIDDLQPDDMMVLLNALAFDAEWMIPYTDPQVADGVFTTSSGVRQNAKFMASSEYTYLNDGKATGFVKPYADRAYNFVALLPNEGVSMSDYVASLSGDGWLRTLGSATGDMVQAQLPEFSFSYDASLVKALKAMGMTDAFDPELAQFRDMAQPPPALYIGNVVHSTSISVTPVGTRAGAATAVIMAGTGAPIEPKVVTLDRPFVFAITDATTNLPIFIGVTNSVA